MIPNLPRPLLWTEIKSMDEFLNGDIINNGFYNHFWNIYKNQISVYLTPLKVFNELYYQLTRIYYEKPSSRDYYSYFEDIQKNLGKASNATLASLIMMMIYHHIRLRAPQELKSGNIEMLNTIFQTQSSSMYWNVFQSIQSFTRLPVPQIDPKTPSPVSPKSLEKYGIDWLKTTRFYDIASIKEILSLWKKEEDRKFVANVLMEHMPAKENPFLLQSEREKIRNYLEQVIGKKEEKSSSSKVIPKVVVTSETSNGGMTHTTFKIIHPKESDKNIEELAKKDKEILHLENDINSYIKEIDRLIKKKNASEKESSQATRERDEYKKKVDELEKRIKELEKQHEEDETRMMTGFGALVLEEIEDGKVISRQLLNTDVNKALAESQRQNKLSQQQLKEIEKQKELLRDKFEKKIKELQVKLGEETVPLSVLAEGLKEYVEEAGFDEVHKLFNHLNNLLITVPAWTKNVPALKRFFQKVRKEIERGYYIQGDFVQHKSVGNEVNGVATGGTGISINKE